MSETSLLMHQPLTLDWLRALTAKAHIFFFIIVDSTKRALPYNQGRITRSTGMSAAGSFVVRRWHRAWVLYRERVVRVYARKDRLCLYTQMRTEDMLKNDSQIFA
jgi:hypothetical protein